MAGEEASWMKHEGTSSHLQHWQYFAAEMSIAISGECSGGWFSASQGLAKAEVAPGFWLNSVSQNHVDSFGVSVLLYYRSYCSPPPQSLHLLSYSAQAHVISVTPPCSFSSGTERRFQGDEQNRRGRTPQPLGLVMHLGSGLPSSSFVSDWARTRCQMANGGN